MLMQKLGVKEEEFEPFILDICNRCINLGLSSENIAFHIKDLLEFSKTNSSNNSNNNIGIPLSQISEFIQQKADEKKKLEEKIKSLESQIQILNEQKATSERHRDFALHEQHTTAAELIFAGFHLVLIYCHEEPRCCRIRDLFSWLVRFNFNI